MSFLAKKRTMPEQEQVRFFDGTREDG
jgi:hypothetical protein